MQKVYHSEIRQFLGLRLRKIGALFNFENKTVQRLGLLVLCVSIVTTGLTFNIAESNLDNLFSAQKKLKVYFLDVGQGDSIFIIAPNGNTLLLDAGQVGNKAREELGKIIPSFDSYIDVLVGSHADSDHVGGFLSVLKSYQTSLYVDSGFGGDTDVYKNLLEEIRDAEIPVLPAHRGMKIILDQDSKVVLDILFPDMQYVVDKYAGCVEDNRAKIELSNNQKSASKNKLKAKKVKTKNCVSTLKVDTNEYSIVAKLSYGSTSVMLTGDSPVSVEHFLVERSLGADVHVLSTQSLKSDILKVGHHGSKTSTSEEFVQSVAPEFAVISAGLKNRYGHPHKDIVATLEKYFESLDDSTPNKNILRTDTGGTIEFVSDGLVFTRDQ